MTLLFLTAVASAADYRTPAGNRPANATPPAIVLPGGRLITPVGELNRTGPGTFGLAVDHATGMVATADGGPNNYSVTLIQGQQTRRIQAKNKSDPNDDAEDEWRSVFMGLAFDGKGGLFISEGNSGQVRHINVKTGKRLHRFDLNTATFKDSYSGDMALDRDRGLLYVIDQANFRLAIIDLKRGTISANLRVGRLPFAIALAPDKQRVYITNLGLFEYKALDKPVPFPVFGFPSKEASKSLGSPNALEANSVAVIDVVDSETPKLRTFIRTGLPLGKASSGGSSPSGVVASATHIYVSNAHNDSVTVIDAGTLKVDREIPIRIPGLERYRGIMPIGMALDGDRLLVAEAGINALGVLDLAQNKVIGHVPTPWFPTQVRVSGKSVYVASAKGYGTGPNAGLAQSFQADLRRGVLATLTLPLDLTESTATVMANNGFLALEQAAPLPDQLRYAVIIVKENRTYDEVFGPGARFGSAVTPNHQSLKQRWASGDNFYADSEVSVDGHHWLVGSYPNAWTESSLMASYGSQKDFRGASTAPGRLQVAESSSSVHPEEYLEAGTLWHHLDRNKVTFRNFGEGFELAGVKEGEGLMPTGAEFVTNVPMPDPLYRNTSRQYPQYNTNIPDQYRATVFLNELKEMKQLPKLIFIHLPNDHTAKPRPKDGYPQVASYVADNDYALGRILQGLSNRPEWKQMAVFITEDDAQGGVDSVDSHRTVLLVASPYSKPNYVLHRNTSFPSLLKTVFRILRVPPLNLYDATAADLSECFQPQANFEPYDLKEVDPRIFEPVKARDPVSPPPSSKMDDPADLRRGHRK